MYAVLKLDDHFNNADLFVNCHVKNLLFSSRKTSYLMCVLIVNYIICAQKPHPATFTILFSFYTSTGCSETSCKFVGPLTLSPGPEGWAI